MNSVPPFVDISGVPSDAPEFWESIVITGEEINSEVDRLASIPRPSNGRRESLVVHPMSTAPGLGLAPGIQVKLSVLLPGERTEPIRHNSTLINFCIKGAGTAVIDRQRIDYDRYDVFNTPSYRSYAHLNDTDDVHVRLTYSNAALLERMRVHVVEENPRECPIVPQPTNSIEDDHERLGPPETIDLDGSGAQLMPYETVIKPPVVRSTALHWPWTDVQAHLDKLEALGDAYVGRRLYLLYNPMTGRTNGTTPSFFSTITIRPPGIADRPHRHVSAAINYYFNGQGYSQVNGRRYDWKKGDLMLSAPGWAVHNHASGDEYVYELTVQDQPLNLAMESLLWQEDLNRDPVLLGSDGSCTDE